MVSADMKWAPVFKSRLWQVGCILSLIGAILTAALVPQIKEEYLWYLLYGPKPAQTDIPTIREIVAGIPGVEVDKIEDASAWENQEVYLHLTLEGKGKIKLLNATASSFVGGGRILLMWLGDCPVSPVRDLSGPDIARRYPDIYIASVTDLIERFDALYASLIDNVNNRIDRRKPGCVR